MRGVDGKNKQVADGLRAWAAEGGHRLHVVEIDVTENASVQAGVGRAIELAGGLDTVINNAAVGTLGVQEGFTQGANHGQIEAAYSPSASKPPDGPDPMFDP
jgi:NAD(P)-dependent dehydrogenase (short-subunit alcohol dehydrogenase family)